MDTWKAEDTMGRKQGQKGEQVDEKQILLTYSFDAEHTLAVRVWTQRRWE